MAVAEERDVKRLCGRENRRAVTFNGSVSWVRSNVRDELGAGLSGVVRVAFDGSVEIVLEGKVTGDVRFLK